MKRRSRGFEVVFVWQDTPLATELFRAGEAVWVGDRAGARFSLPSRMLAAPFALLEPDGHGGSRVGAPADARVEHDGTTTTVRLGDFAFVVREGDMPGRVASSTPPDWRAWRYMGLSVLLHSLIVGMFQLVPPDAMALSRDLDPDRARHLRFRLDAAERDPAPALPFPPSDAERTAGGEGSTGAAPAQEATPTRHRGGGPGGPRRAPAPVTAESVRSLSTLRAVGEAVAVLTGTGDGPYAGSGLHRDAIGTGGDSPFGGLFGGLDMGDSGRGTCSGSECGVGTIGAGPLATRSGSYGTPEPGMRRCEDRPQGCGKIPHISGGKTETQGGLASEQVRRVVRRNVAQVRFCYEQALQRRPDLQGRVAVRFVVQPTGMVQSALVASSDLSSPEAEACITRSVRRWTFPQADGVTLVTYPFMLRSR